MSKYQCINLMLLVMVCICSSRISGHLAKKTNNFDIDDFINQLLSSQKFDELADKVAEKAVKKIKNMNPSENISEQRTQTKQSNEVAEIEKDKNNESKGVEDERKKVIHNESNETPQHRQQNKIQYQEGVERHKVAVPVKINAQALLKKDDDSEEGELSLNYEYLKKHAKDEKAHNHQDTGSNEPNPWKHLENSKTKQNHPASAFDNQERNAVSAEKNINQEKKTKKTNLHSHNGRDRTGNKNGYNEASKSNKNYGPNLRPQFKSEKIPRLAVIDIDENGERKEIEDTTEEPSKVPKAAIKEKVVEQGGKLRKNQGGIVWRAHYSEVDENESEESDRNAQYSEPSSPGYELGELTTTKRVIRKEGDRYYTYLSGPEYTEFHEQLAKEQSKNRAFR